MGWNSWDAYGLTITEPQFRANVDVLQDKLLPFGWNYAVIDEGWFFENPGDRPTPDKLRYAIDPYGRYVPVPARFPSAVGAGSPLPALPAPRTRRTNSATIESTSFAALGEWVHAQGLKFGIHIVRGIPRAAVERNLPIEGSDFHAQDAADTTDACPWDPTNWGVRDNAAGQAWYDSLLRQYASWGVDLLKVDCIADHPFKLDEIEMIRRAIEKTGRPIVLSLSPGPTALAHAAEVAASPTCGASPTTSGTSGPLAKAPFRKAPGPVRAPRRLGAVRQARQLARRRHAPLGAAKPRARRGESRASRLTPDEQRTELTLWSIARSPLILGANLTLLDDATSRCSPTATSSPSTRPPPRASSFSTRRLHRLAGGPPEQQNRPRALQPGDDIHAPSTSNLLGAHSGPRS
jgi:alpha-galactosidase